MGGALAQSEALVRDMRVFPQKMRADLDITHGLIMAEAVTLALAEFIEQSRGASSYRGAVPPGRWTVTARWSICSRLTHRSVSISLVNA
ncbi:hypothetical protein LNQ03_00815 [Klebsiella pneumoniae subsp. pneumoniae]|nr:hypothetical protein [Klebsiella pneumoniae subsp. pneumoniae]